MWKNGEAFITESRAGIYIHVPFCARKCSYCDFYSLETNPADYLDLVIQELGFYQNEIQNYQFKTLYIGGGTPSLLPLSQVEKLFGELEKKGLMNNLEEITLEVNPDSFDSEKAKFYSEVGINRISLGIQSLDNEILSKLGRLSDSDKNKKSLEITAKYFKNYSVDLIYGVPGQKLEEELKNYQIIHSPHISAYCLTISEGTPLFRKKKEFLLPDLQLNRQFYRIHEFFESDGYKHYEISNYSKKGFESRHNMSYWNGQNYLGLGAGASGYLLNVRYVNENLEEYEKKIRQGIKPILESETLTSENLWIEKWLLGLRKKEGFVLSNEELSKKVNNLIQIFKKKKWIEYSNCQIKPTLKGWTMLDSILKAVNELD